MRDRDLGGLLRRNAVTLGAVVSVVLFGFVIYTLARTTQQNRQAIEKSCTLLNNAIVQSSTAASDPESPSAALIAGILEVIPARYVVLYKARAARAGLVVPLVDCEKVAEDPDGIRAIQLPAPRP